MYFPLVILSMAFLVALAGAPWYAVNHSRPIGDLPYCWGTWVAVTSLISAAGMITLALLGLVWKPATPLGGPKPWSSPATTTSSAWASGAANATALSYTWRP